ncbi:MAG: hypothetical protein MHM6MM_004495 [Cercozoa sp. M6MM]
MVADVPILRIVLTGGPAAGKTTCLERTLDALENLRIDSPVDSPLSRLRCFVVPEAATFLRNNCGFELREFDVTMQHSISETQAAHENAVFRQARTRARTDGAPCVVLLDRGLLDASVFVSENDCVDIMRQVLGFESGLSFPECRSKVFERYDSVVFLQTAAANAQARKDYQSDEAEFEKSESEDATRVHSENSENLGRMRRNRSFTRHDEAEPPRHEAPGDAVRNCNALRRVYTLHPNARIFDANADFDTKVSSAANHIVELVKQHYS